MVMVSIIIPVYNTEKYLKQCVDSIISQSYKEFEIILVDDGSTDSSSCFCDEYAAADNRIKVIHKLNKGVSSARNAGIESAIGEYIMFIDSDDYIAPDMVEALISGREEYNAEMAVCGFYVFSNVHFKEINYEGAFYNKRNEIATFFSLLNGRTNSVCNKLYKREFIKVNFDEKLTFGEDLIFNLDYLRNCSSLVVLDKSLYYYRRDNKKSLSQTYHKDSFETSRYLHERLIGYFAEYIEENINYDILNMYFFEDTLNYIIRFIKSSENKIDTSIRRIGELCNDRVFRLAIMKITDITLKYKLLRLLIKYHMSTLIFIFIKMWCLLKRNQDIGY